MYSTTSPSFGATDVKLILIFWSPLRRDREDPQPHEAVAEVLEQAGVLRAADDVGVDLVGLLGVEQFAPLLLAVHPHGELVDAGTLGHREEVGRFELAVGVVAEGLLDGGDRPPGRRW